MPYLPALHDIGRELDVPPIAVQQTLSVYLFACAFMIGAFISGRGAGRMAPLRTIGLGYIVMFAGVVLDLAISVSVPPSVPWHVMPIMVCAMGSSILMSSATLLLDLFPATRGLASSLQGLLQFVLAAINVGTIAPILAGSLLTLALGMADFTMLSVGLWVIYLRHRPVAGIA